MELLVRTMKDAVSFSRVTESEEEQTSELMFHISTEAQSSRSSLESQNTSSRPKSRSSSFSSKPLLQSTSPLVRLLSYAMDSLLENLQSKQNTWVRRSPNGRSTRISLDMEKTRNSMSLFLSTQLDKMFPWRLTGWASMSSTRDSQDTILTVLVPHLIVKKRGREERERVARVDQAQKDPVPTSQSTPKHLLTVVLIPQIKSPTALTLELRSHLSELFLCYL